MKIGLYATGLATSSYQDLLDQVQYADDVGLDSVWLGERHFHQDHQGRNVYTSPFVVAAYIAARTRRLRIAAGDGIRILPERDTLCNISRLLRANSAQGTAR
jgi:alkanesulfonate monooxygenase SsuD/methylene tetrahydromethanopterin reductase-like flavin-dependent oxidoreductase (luciferase family)